MSCIKWSNLLRLLPFALATLPALSAEQHNIVLLVPEVLPAAAVDHSMSPTLARLRAEGVYFSNSHSGFPMLPGANGTGKHVNVRSVLRAASHTHSVGAVEDIEVDGREKVDDGDPLPVVPAVLKTTSLDEVYGKLSAFKEGGRPFVLVYRFGSLPMKPLDGPMHITHRTGGDDEPALVNALLTAEGALTEIEAMLKKLELFDATNIIVAAERGASFVWRMSGTSVAMTPTSDQGRWGPMTPGFLVTDIAEAVMETDPGISLFDLDYDEPRWLDWTTGKEHPKRGNGLIAVTPEKPLLFLKARGDHGLIYLSKDLSGKETRRLARTVVDAVFQQDYTSGVFVNDGRVGQPRGTLPLKHLGWDAPGTIGVPDIVVTFVSMALDCDRPVLCTATVADTPLDQGQHMPGSFSRADTWTFMAARGPDFQSGLYSRTPASNADIVNTIGELLQVPAEVRRNLPGRVLTETLRGNEGMEPRVRKQVFASRKRPEYGQSSEIHLQSVGDESYFVAAGCPGYTVGIAMPPEPLVDWRPWKWNWPNIKIEKLRIEITPEDPKFDPMPPLIGQDKRPE